MSTQVLPTVPAQQIAALVNQPQNRVGILKSKKQAALVNKPHVFPDAIGQVENAEIEDEEQLFANELVVIEKENDGDTEFANE